MASHQGDGDYNNTFQPTASFPSIVSFTQSSTASTDHIVASAGTTSAQSTSIGPTASAGVQSTPPSDTRSIPTASANTPKGPSILPQSKTIAFILQKLLAVILFCWPCALLSESRALVLQKLLAVLLLFQPHELDSGPSVEPSGMCYPCIYKIMKLILNRRSC